MSERTVRVRIAVAVQPDGGWNAAGWEDGSDNEKLDAALQPMTNNAAHVWIEAEVPVPPEVTIEGQVKEA